MVLPTPSISQNLIGKVQDMTTNADLPFAIVAIGNRTELTNVQGSFTYSKGDTISIQHPFYEPGWVIGNDSVVVRLKRRELAKVPELSEAKIKEVQKLLELQDPMKKASFEFASNQNIKLEINKSDVHPDSSGWTNFYSINQIFLERFIQKNNWYRNVVSQEIKNNKEDLEKREVRVPVLINSLNPTLEYLNVIEERFYNPFYKGAEKRYKYFAKDTTFNAIDVQYILAEPKSKKNFKSFRATLVIRKSDNKVFGITYQTVNHSYGVVTSIIANESFIDGTMIPSQISIEGYFPRYPRRRFGVKFDISADYFNYTPIDPDTTERKLSLALLGQADSSKVSTDSIQFQPLDQNFNRNLHYLEKDTTERKMTVQKFGDFGLDFSEGRVALKAGPFYLNNVFGLNKFEGLRLGIGLKTREEISDKFTASGYGAFGFKDGKFKYGAGIGYNIGKKQKSVIGVIIKDDLKEPGRPRYLGEQRDLFRNFFASRMDRIISQSIAVESSPTFYTKFSGVVESYTLEPQYDYRYAPDVTDTVGTSGKFYFSEAKFRMLIGGRENTSGGLSQLFLRQWGKFPKLFVNYSRGFDLENGGDYYYDKFSTKITQLIKWDKVGIFDLVVELGIMTENTPYQIMFTAPGSDTALGSIIINDAFQTLELYKFISDRFVHSFSSYYFRESSTNLKKFNPRFGLSWSMGWGVVQGNINIHKGIEVQDYPHGYYEAGILIEDILNINVYDYFVTRLGFGFYVGMGSYAKDVPLAARLTYAITPQ